MAYTLTSSRTSSLCLLMVAGIGSTGMFNGKIQRMLDLVPSNIHDRCPVILGSPRDVEVVLNMYKS